MSQPCRSPDPDEPEYLTRQEAADYLRVSVQTIDRFARHGHLTRYHLPTTREHGRGHVLYRRDDVRKLPRKKEAQ